MIWIDVALKAVALVSAMIATLRAGSRAVYLLENGSIGVMDGPLILPSKNETNPMFELSEAFRHCVRLSLFPQFYEKTTRRSHKILSPPREPYRLSPAPQKPYSGPPKDSDEYVDEEIEKMVEAITWVEDTPSLIRRRMDQIKGVLPGISASVSTRLEKSKAILSVAPKITSYWAKRVLNRDIWSTAATVDPEDDIDQEWDYHNATETDLHFNSTEGISRTAELAVFSSNAFADLRSRFGISEEDYRKSMFGSGPFVSFQSNSKGAARVGGVFFFTRDGAYMIKTIKAEEAKTFLKMLPKYHKYMKRFGRKSLLTRFCGMYTVRITDDNSSDRGELQTFVVMNSVFPAEASKFISERFDLKGSTVGREVSEEELRTKGSNAVLKDLDLAREVELVKTLDTTRGPPTEYGLNIGAVAKAALLSQLRHDVKLLIDCQVMDYSLLVGVVNMDSHKYDQSAQRALSILRDQERHLQRLSKHTPKIDEMALHTLATPVRLLLSPPLFITRKLWSLARRTFSSVVTLPLPYYGAGQPTVDGGTLAVLHGTRRGDRAVYYMGLIDFLQPWTTRKVFERHWKSLIGYDIGAISCVDPEEYASRFLDFIDTHVS